MKTFKEFLNEKPTYSRSSMNMIFRAGIPLTKKIVKVFDKASPEMEVYHATSLEYLSGMKELGKTSSQISTFTKGLGSVINSVSVKPDVLCLLEGKAEYISDFDIYSHPDETGTRWIETKNDFLREAILKPVIKKMYQLAETDLKEELLYILLQDETKLKVIYQYFEFTSKQNKELLKFYEDNILRLMKMSMYKKLFIEQIENIKNPKLTHNEIIMSKFKVLGVYSIEAGKYQYDHSMAEFQITNLGYKYLGFISKEDFKKF